MRQAKRKQLIVSGEGIPLPVLSTYIGLWQSCTQRDQFVIPSKIIHFVGTQLPQNAILVQIQSKTARIFAKYNATWNSRCDVIYAGPLNLPNHRIFLFSLQSLVACCLCLMNRTWSLHILTCSMLVNSLLASPISG